VEPITCPPTTAATLDLARIEEADFLYIDLHGEPGQRFWLGDDGELAMTAAQVETLDLSGTVVFAVSCYLADADSPMLDALLDAGARYVIGGEGLNWAAATRPTGAAALGHRLRQLLAYGFDPLRALALAKRFLKLGVSLGGFLGQGEDAPTEDALAFRAYHKEVI
jgi:hypothetical protein